MLYILCPSCTPVSSCGLVNHCNIVCSCFIVLYPAPVDEIQLAICYQLPDSCLDRRGLTVPPGTEKGLQAGTCCKATCHRLWPAVGTHEVAGPPVRHAQQQKQLVASHKWGRVQKMWSLCAACWCSVCEWFLVLKPHHFSIAKAPVWVVFQALHHGAQDMLHGSTLQATMQTSMSECSYLSWRSELCSPGVARWQHCKHQFVALAAGAFTCFICNASLVFVCKACLTCMSCRVPQKYWSNVFSQPESS